MRHAVPLDAIRLQFQQADLVDVFSKRDGGIWLEGSIIGRQSLGATSVGYGVNVDEQNVGYRIHVDEQNIWLENFPAHRLRRRLPPGCAVEVYRGPPRGWVGAVVHPTAKGLRANEMVTPLSMYSPGFEAHATANDVRTSRTSRTSRREKQVNANMFRVWMYVPICEEGAEQGDVSAIENVEPEWLPSYLVRMCVACALRPTDTFNIEVLYNI